MKSSLKFILPIVFVVLGLIFFINRSGQTVLVVPATLGTAVNAVTGTVEVFANADVDLKSERRGVLKSFEVSVGDKVEKGDLIATQASEETELRLENARIRLEAAIARSEVLSPSMIDLETIRDEVASAELRVRLQQSSQTELDRILREQEKRESYLSLEGIATRENIALLRNQIEQLELEMSQMNIRAPFAGKIAGISVFVGDQINLGATVARLLSPGRFVTMELSEEDYFGVKVGQPVTLRLASYPDRSFEGKVSSLGQTADSSSKTREVFVEVAAPDDLLVPGLTGEGYLVKSERENAILIPRRALIGNLVYVVDGGEVEIRRVRPGFLGLNQAEILEGIEAGDLIVVENQNLLRAGDSVNVETIAR